MFCTKCGRTLKNGEICTCQQTQQMPALALLKKTLSSGLFLAIAILYSVAILCSLITTVTLPVSVSNMTTEMQDVLDEGMYGISMQAAIDSLDAMEEGINSMYPIILIVSLISMIPAVLIVIGLWKLYATAKSKNEEAMNPGGFTFIKVSVMIELIVTCVICAVCIIVLVVLMAVIPSLAQEIFGSAESAEGFVTAMIMVLAIFLAVFVAVMALMIIYCLKALKTIKVVKTTMITGQPNDKVSIFLIVMLFLATTSVFSGLTTLFISPLAGISTLCTGAFSCVTAIALCIYRSKMKVLLYAPAQPQQIYQQPAYQVKQSYTVTYTACEICGQQYPSGADVCPKCGAQNTKKF